MTYRRYATLMSAGIALLLPVAGFGDTVFTQSNLVSDLPGVAAHQDLQLVNPWGIAFSNTSPIWIADNHTGLSTVYDGAGNLLSPPSPVTIPPPVGGMSPAAPDGVIFNANHSSGAFGGNLFIFSTEDGTISAWNGGSSATLEVDNSGNGSVYKGIAAGTDGARGNLLYATNFRLGTIDVFDTNFNPTTVGGTFTDPTLPPGYAPFNIENIGGLLYVTYALQDSQKHDDVGGPGHGFIDVYTTDGVLLSRAVSQGVLNSPWGLAVAPSDWGSFAGDLLVGNFGDGTINAFTLSGTFVGTLDNTLGNPLVNQGLWGLAFGNGAFGTSTDTLYFTAGIPGPDMVEDHGLFGAIDMAPEPGYLWLMAVLAAGLIVLRRRSAKSSV